MHLSLVIAQTCVQGRIFNVLAVFTFSGLKYTRPYLVSLEILSLKRCGVHWVITPFSVSFEFTFL